MKYPKLLYDMADGPPDWYTPKYIIDALGPFDTDPYSPLARPFDTARIHYTEQDNGLCQPWIGSVWLNPPYNNIKPWMKAMARHRNGIALVYNRLGRKWFDTWVMPYATGLRFVGTISFLTPDGKTKGKSPQPCVLVAYDPLDIGGGSLRNWTALRKCGLPGYYMDRLSNWFKDRKEWKLQRQLRHDLK